MSVERTAGVVASSARTSDGREVGRARIMLVVSATLRLEELPNRDSKLAEQRPGHARQSRANLLLYKRHDLPHRWLRSWNAELEVL